jgi:NAD(P)-dependent dehydrogenase (short-subunit alcohol dehydrogenase family)
VAVLVDIAAGLGHAVAEAFAGAGVRVAGLSRGEAFGERLERELEGFRHFVCDVTDAARVAEVLDAIDRDFGLPGVLVYNPMKLVVKPFEELSAEEFESVWRVTCLGAMTHEIDLRPFDEKF